MNVIRFTDPDFSLRVCQLAAASRLFDKTIEDRARTICDAVQTRGDEALLEFTERFGGARLTVEQLPATKAELLQASLKADQGLRQAVTLAGRNIEMFSG